MAVRIIEQKKAARRRSKEQRWKAAQERRETIPTTDMHWEEGRPTPLLPEEGWQIRSVEGRQPPKDRRTGQLTTPPPVKIRSVKPKDRRRPPPSLSEELQHKERVIREFLFWPDGTSKICTRVQVANREHENVHRLIEALLDKQNDDKGRVDELKDIVHWQSIREGVGKWYYHLNLTVKTKGAAEDGASTNLFFAEVARDRNMTIGYYINTFSMVNTDSKDDEAICHGCINNGSNDMKHPPADVFEGGHEDIRFPLGFGPCNDKQWRDSDSNKEEDQKLIKEEEERISESFNYLDDAAYLENLRHKRRHVRIYPKIPNIEDINIQEDEEMAC